MTARHGRFHATVTRLIADVGTAMTLRRVTDATYDPTLGALRETVHESRRQGVIEAFETDRVDGTLIHQGDHRVTLAAKSGEEPLPGDMVVIDGVVHTVIAVSAAWSGDVAIYHRLHIRR